MTTQYDLNRRLIKAASELEDALAELEKRSREWAEAEHVYRRHKAISYLAAEGSNITEREAYAENRLTEGRPLNSVRYERDLADVLKSSALELVRARRAILSAVQTIANLSREEAAFARTGPQWGEG